MAAPRPKKTPVKKPGVKSPAETRKSISRKQVGTSRPARGDLGARAQYLKYGPTQPQGPEAPTYREKIGPVKPNAADPKRPILRLEKGGRLLIRKDAGSVLLKRAITKIPVVGAAVGFIADAAPAGEGSTKDKYSTLKKKYSSAIGPKQPAGTKKASTGLAEGRSDTGMRIKYSEPIGPKKPKASMSGDGVNNPSGKSSGDALRRRGAGTYTASYDVKAKKSGTSQAASVAPATGSSGASQASSAGKTKRRSPTRYQRNELAMEQRKRSSSKPKKSIFSLFRKG